MRFVIMIIVLFLGSAQEVSAAHRIFQKSFRMDLVQASGTYNHEVRKTGMHGIAGKPAAASLQAVGAAKPQPLTQTQLMELVVGGVPNQRAAELIRERGIDFEVDDSYLRSLRQAGAGDELIAALRKASVTLAGVLVETSPNAQVFLDGNLRGRADAQGVMTLRAKLGVHTLKVTLAGKQDFEQRVTVEKGPPTRVVAYLGTLRKASVATAGLLVETSPSAQIFLDGNLEGQADAQGVVTIRALVGVHTLKVTLAGKQDFEQSVTVVERQSTRVVAPLADLAGSVRVKTLAGAALWLDNSIRGTVDASGVLLLGGVSPGAHQLRITAPGKVADSRSIAVAAGAETLVEAALADAVRENPQDGLKYVWIAAGNFVMGCSPGDNDCSDPEKPAHPVTLQTAYWIGQTEVTVGAYKRFVATGKVKLPPVSPKLNRGWKKDSFPIVNAVWDEANQYCAWAGGRLPTEAEWEFAARAGSLQARYGSLSEIAWSRENADNQTHEVAAKLANAYGLYDTLGNVWEWVNDWYDANYYQSSPAQDPAGPATGQERVLRGGSWIVDPKLLRVSDRYNYKPDARSEYFGFRCVWEPQTP
jgi:formylglycine-generating enzyme required for sulfatase activity